MPQMLQPERATLQEIWWDESGTSKPTTPEGQQTTAYKVQFNPQTLKVNYSNHTAGGVQAAGAALQYIGQRTSLSVELLFDSTVTETVGNETDVRNSTKEVHKYMLPTKKLVDAKPFAPGVRFQWGAFLFEGVMDSMDESIELFSEKGTPLRATVSIHLSQPGIQFMKNDTGGAGGFPGGTPGTEPLLAAQGGESYQQTAAKAGVKDWKAGALANGIEDPRRLAAGALVSVKSAQEAARQSAARLGLSI